VKNPVTGAENAQDKVWRRVSLTGWRSPATIQRLSSC